MRAYDPVVAGNSCPELPGVVFALDAASALEGAAAVLLATEWSEFKDLDWRRLKQVVAAPCLIDGRNMLNPVEMRALGWHYVGVGRP